MPRELKATVELENTPAAGDQAGKTIEVPFTIENAYRLADVMTFGIFFAISVVSLWLTGTTAGKWLLGLKVKGVSRVPALRRETLRTMPHILCVVVITAMNDILRVQPDLYQTLYVPGLIISIGGILYAAVLWLLPLLRWRGEMPYERWLGLQVVRTSPRTA